jgi:hypothetical protein
MGKVAGEVAGSSGIVITDPVAVAGDTAGGIGVCGTSAESSGVAGHSLLDCGVVGSGHSAGMRALGTVRGLVAIAGETAVPQGSAAIEASCNLGTGVYANSVTNAAIFAYSAEADAIYATSGDGHAIRGFAQGSGSAVVGESAKGLAGSFVGPVSVQGALTVFGAKSAAVRHKDGRYRTFYCQESPESWLEDFGEAQLKRGKVTVRIEKQFAGCVNTRTYHVFLTPRGDCNGLFVTDQDPEKFLVCELGDGRSNVSFSYRVVARRADIDAPRLARVSRPKPSPAPRRPQREPFDMVHPSMVAQGIRKSTGRSSNRRRDQEATPD